VLEMVDSIVLDQKRVLPCAAKCDGEYGADGLFVGVPVKLGKDGVEEIVQRTRDGGAEVGKLLQKGSAFYAPSAATVEMIDAIVFDQKRVLPCAALCQGEYGIDGLFVGVPVRLGKEGVEEIIEIDLGDREKKDLDESAGAVRELVDAMAKL